MYNNGNSSKNVTGASVVDGTLENADYADNAISGDKIDGGTISGSVTLVTPDIGTPSAGTLTNCSGTASSLTAGNVTTNANLTGVVTSSGNATAIADNAISGDKIDAGIISNLQSTGIDDRLSTGTVVYTKDSNAVGIGVTPKTWHTAYRALQFGTTGAIGAESGDAFSFIGANAYINASGAWSRTTADFAALHTMANGTHSFRVAGTSTADSAISWTEAMSIDNSGNVLIGTTTAGGKLTSTSTSNGTFGSASVGTDYAKSSRVTSGAGYADFFYTGTGSTYAGYIYANGGTTTYATTSDYRLKENVVPMTGSIDRLKDLKPSKFNFIGEDKTVDGFLAHEAQSVVPECVHGTKDAMHPEVLYTSDDELPEGVNIGDVKEASAPDYQGIDQSKLVPLLVASLQEAIARIEILENV